MNSYLEKISTSFNNPFLLSLIIVGILNLMFFFTTTRVNGSKKKNLKSLVRSIFYQYIVTTFILYLHHSGLEKEFKKNFESNLNLNLVSRVGTGENLIKPDKINVFEKETDQNDEDEFI